MFKNMYLTFNPNINQKINVGLVLNQRPMFLLALLLLLFAVCPWGPTFSCVLIASTESILPLPTFLIKTWRRMEGHSNEKFWKSPWTVKWDPLEVSWTFLFIMQEITELAQADFVYWKRGSLKYRCIFCPVSDCSWMRVWGLGVLGSVLGAHYPWDEQRESPGFPCTREAPSLP